MKYVKIVVEDVTNDGTASNTLATFGPFTTNNNANLFAEDLQQHGSRAIDILQEDSYRSCLRLVDNIIYDNITSMLSQTLLRTMFDIVVRNSPNYAALNAQQKHNINLIIGSQIYNFDDKVWVYLNKHSKQIFWLVAPYDQAALETLTSDWTFVNVYIETLPTIEPNVITKYDVAPKVFVS